MKQIWAPWRLAYVTAADSEPGCIFCTRPQIGISPETLVVHKEPQAFVILNKYPYNNGHVMVAPIRHVPSIDHLDQSELLALFTLVSRTSLIIKSVFNCDGMNIGINVGRVAGAGIEEHLHVHLVPRWNGDTNFMPVFGDVRVIPQALEDAHAKLRRAFEETGETC